MVGAARSFHAETPRSDAKGPGALSCDASFLSSSVLQAKALHFPRGDTWTEGSDNPRAARARGLTGSSRGPRRGTTPPSRRWSRGSSNERRRGYQVNTLYTHSKRHGPRKKNKISCSLVHLINYFSPWYGWLTYSNGVLKAMCWRELEWSEYGTDLGRHCTCAGAITSEVIKSMIYIAYTTRRCVCISLLLLVRWTMWNALQKQASCQARGTGRTG